MTKRLVRFSVVASLVGAFAAGGCNLNHPRRPDALDALLWQMAVALPGPGKFCDLARDPRFARYYQGSFERDCRSGWHVEGVDVWFQYDLCKNCWPRKCADGGEGRYSGQVVSVSILDCDVDIRQGRTTCSGPGGYLDVKYFPLPEVVAYAAGPGGCPLPYE